MRGAPRRGGVGVGVVGGRGQNRDGRVAGFLLRMAKSGLVFCVL